jgi:hypothetical protein
MMLVRKNKYVGLQQKNPTKELMLFWPHECPRQFKPGFDQIDSNCRFEISIFNAPRSPWHKCRQYDQLLTLNQQSKHTDLSDTPPLDIR